MSMLKKLTILHSNDMHGDFLAEEVDHQLIGGVSMLSGYVNAVRSEEENTLYCVAGDMFRGSVIDAEFKGVSTIEIMNAIAPDVVTLGNHEIDYGLAHLLFLEKCARFPIINCNLYIKTNHSRLFKSHIIKEIGGMKVLFIGIITESVLRATRNEAMVGTLVDVYEAAQEVGKICNAYRTMDIDLTVLLTHIGFEQDKELAKQLNPAWGVDIIIGGHSHTFIDKPEIVNNVVIVQAGTGTDIIGRFDLVVNTEENCIQSYKWQGIPINSEHCPKDTYIESLIHSYKTKTDKKYGRVITRFPRQLMHPTRIRQTEIGSLFADAIASSKHLDVVFLGSGSIRTETLGPLVMYADLMTAFPYDGPLYLLKVTGLQLKQMIRFMLRDEVWEGKVNSIFQVSKRIGITYCMDRKEFTRLTFDGKDIEDYQIYKIGVMKYHYQNFDNYFGFGIDEIESMYKHSIISTSIRDIIENYLLSNPSIDGVNDQRVIIL